MHLAGFADSPAGDGWSQWAPALNKGQKFFLWETLHMILTEFYLSQKLHKPVLSYEIIWDKAFANTANIL